MKIAKKSGQCANIDRPGSTDVMQYTISLRRENKHFFIKRPSNQDNNNNKLFKRAKDGIFLKEGIL